MIQSCPQSCGGHRISSRKKLSLGNGDLKSLSTASQLRVLQPEVGLPLTSAGVLTAGAVSVSNSRSFTAMPLIATRTSCNK
eukprot:6174647-Pleurochrysis_carterae.AAC.2